MPVLGMLGFVFRLGLGEALRNAEAGTSYSEGKHEVFFVFHVSKNAPVQNRKGGTKDSLSSGNACWLVSMCLFEPFNPEKCVIPIPDSARGVGPM